MNNQKLELCLGPMSSEVIEAVYKSSNETGKKLFLIASKNQIDYNRGYVNNWTTKEYMSFINTMKEKYSESNVLVCRDHCGPGFNGIQDLKDVMSTIKADIENGFDLIHIDYCHFKGTQDEKLAASKKAVEYCLELNPNIQLEIGTDENVGSNFDISQLNRIESEVLE
jgi:fructose/tagatose bisphosphate aldolase